MRSAAAFIEALRSKEVPHRTERNADLQALSWQQAILKAVFRRTRRCSTVLIEATEIQKYLLCRYFFDPEAL